MSKIRSNSKYKEEYCEKIIDYMATGKSKEAFCGEIGIHRDTLYEWIKKHEDFKEACKYAEAKCQNFWEELGVQMAIHGQGNATAWIFNMKNRFGWRDKTETEISTGAATNIRLDIRGGDRIHNNS